MRIKKATHGTVAAADSASAEALAANHERKYAELFNGSDVSLWLAFGTAAVIGTGILLPVGASYVIDGDNLWVGAVNVIAASGSGKTLGSLELS
jgi:hypothetical protein